MKHLLNGVAIAAALAIVAPVWAQTSAPMTPSAPSAPRAPAAAAPAAPAPLPIPTNRGQTRCQRSRTCRGFGVDRIPRCAK